MQRNKLLLPARPNSINNFLFASFAAKFVFINLFQFSHMICVHGKWWNGFVFFRHPQSSNACKKNKKKKCKNKSHLHIQWNAVTTWNMTVLWWWAQFACVAATGSGLALSNAISYQWRFILCPSTATNGCNTGKTYRDCDRSVTVRAACTCGHYSFNLERWLARKMLAY